MKLSQDTKEAIKTALAMTIAYGISLQMGWDKPYWAGLVVAVISLSTVGQSLNKGILRMAGTVIGAIVALILIALFAQQRWLFMFFVSLWFAFCSYMNMGPRHQYAWFVAGLVSLIIAVDGGPDSGNAFTIAMLRLQQTGLGILVYTLVSILLWPNDSRAAFANSALTLADTQHKLFRASLESLRGSGDSDTLQSLRAQQIAGIASFGTLLDAAVTDSDEVREVQQQWRDYQSALGGLAECMQRWRENFSELQSLPLTRLLPGLDSLAAELDTRFAGIAQMLQGTATQHACGDVNLDPDATALGELSYFHRAALQSAQRHLLEINTLSTKMFDTISAIRNFTKAPRTSGHSPTQSLPFTPDPDRLLSSGKIMLILWLAFLAVVYVGDFPGGMGFVSMCGSIGLVLVSMPQMPVRMLIGPFTLAILFASGLYIFVMPQLSSFAGLGLMIFTATFGICYRYAAPQKGLNRAIALAMFAVLISVSNQQSYNFLSVANTALMFALLFLLMGVVAYIPFSALPERALLRLLRRYFRSAAFMLTQEVYATGAAPPTRRNSFHQREVASLPTKMQAWAGHADAAVLGAISVQQLPVLVGKLQALSYRLQALQGARALPQATQLLALTDDMLDWRQKLIEALQRLADDPTDHETLQQARLDQLLAALEVRVAQTLDRAGPGGLSSKDGENLYSLLGAYRGVSQALLDFADTAATIEWQPWYEERFA